MDKLMIAQQSPLMIGAHYNGYDRPADQTDKWPSKPTVYNRIEKEIKNLPF